MSFIKNQKNEYTFLGSLLLALLVTAPVLAVEQESMKENKSEVRTWNDFVTDLLKLHERQIKDRKITKKEKHGGYSSEPKFYLEEEYVDVKTGKLLSRLQWEREKPENIHAIEVFVHDDQGRVIRDYSASYLPRYRNAPSQTLIFLHDYKDGVHAFRSFDASGDRLFERCQGKYDGKEIDLRLDEDELEEARYQKRAFNKGVMTSAVYLHCFGEIEETAELYLTPN